MNPAATQGMYAYTPGSATRGTSGTPQQQGSRALGVPGPATTPNYQLPVIGLAVLAGIGLALEWRRIKRGF